MGLKFLGTKYGAIIDHKLRAIDLRLHLDQEQLTRFIPLHTRNIFGPQNTINMVQESDTDLEKRIHKLIDQIEIREISIKNRILYLSD